MRAYKIVRADQVRLSKRRFCFLAGLFRSTSVAVLLGSLAVLTCRPAFAQQDSDCLACHSDETLTGHRAGQVMSVYVNEARFTASVHGSVTCIGCHADLEGKDLPHADDLKRVDCGKCHSDEQALHSKSLHGKAVARGDPLAPRCSDCHGKHDIVAASDPKSPVAPLQIPRLCGKCHEEGAPVQRQRDIAQDRILENYSESIHGEGLLRKGLIVAPSCASCHTAHSILPHTDPASSISRGRIASTCTKCHAEIEQVHRAVIKGELWEKQAHILPACVDCHQPHKIRRVLYDQGMADADCLRCHSKDLRASKDGRSLQVHVAELQASRHAKTACSQCHSQVNASRVRPCETIVSKVDCASCHAEIGQQHQRSIHGRLVAAKDPNAPTCKDCHGTHGVLGKLQPQSPTFSTNIPTLLCGQCHRQGQKAALRRMIGEQQIVESYTESIHGKGLLKSGLTVTATCTNCHTAHQELPKKDPASSVNPKNVPKTCGTCHHGVEAIYKSSVHFGTVTKSGEKLPSCSDCHTAHTIQRADQDAFRLEIMNKCGRCHNEIARTYFDTFHGKVSQLGYTKTAKCYDCHGAHDILPITNPKSRLSRANVVQTCQKCHPGATRRFAGYLTHATHHDPVKYPFLFWTFWGMTTLLIGTFVFGGIHTLLWLPRAMQMRRQQRRARVDV